MRFKVVDGRKSFICVVPDDGTLENLYAQIHERTKESKYLFRRSPFVYLANSNTPIASVLNDAECLCLMDAPEVKGPTETPRNEIEEPELVFSVMEVPSDNSCLFHSLSELLDAKSSTELRRMVADTILGDTEAFRMFIEKDPFSYSKWITDAKTWGGATEIVIISKIYGTKVCVVDLTGQCFFFGEDFRSVVYLMYTGTHYNPVIARGGNGDGKPVKRFPRGDENILRGVKQAIAKFVGK